MNTDLIDCGMHLQQVEQKQYRDHRANDDQLPLGIGYHGISYRLFGHKPHIEAVQGKGQQANIYQLYPPLVEPLCFRKNPHVL